MSANDRRVAGTQLQAAQLTGVTMQDAMEALRQQGVPVCFEQVPLAPEQATRLPDGRIEYARTHFDVSIPAGAVPTALAALTHVDSDYRWESVGDPPVYVVYPAQASALDWPVPQQYLAGQDWLDALHSLDLEAHNVSLFPRGLERQLRVSLDHWAPGPQIARHWLALLMGYVGQGRYWNLAGVGTTRTLVIGQVPPST